MTIAALALPYQPRGAFAMSPFEQGRAFWYQWLMYVDDGASAVAADPVGFARIQWETWSPPGWFDDGEFDATARSFTTPDWVAPSRSTATARASVSTRGAIRAASPWPTGLRRSSGSRPRWRLRRVKGCRDSSLNHHGLKGTLIRLNAPQKRAGK
jgi:hypothetical protein